MLNWIKTLYQDTIRIRIALQAAAIAFHFFLALFPFLALVMSILGFIPLGDWLFGQLQNYLRMYLPESVQPFFQQLLTSHLRFQKSWLLLSSSGILILWGAMRASRILIVAFNPSLPKVAWWVYTLRMVLLLFVLLFIVLFSSLLLPLKTQLMRWLPQWFPSLFIENSFLFLILCFALTLLYKSAVIKKISWKKVLIASMITALLLVLVSYALDFYFNHFADFGFLYQSLAGLVMVLLWFYALAYLLLVGYLILCRL